MTITFDAWGPATLRELSAVERALSHFTRQTGIQVKVIPGLESETDRIRHYLEALESKSSTPDVYFIDVIWPGMLAEHLADLGPYLGEEAKQLVPATVQNDTVGGRLVAMPFNIETGLLYYRTDLLHKYSYPRPPETWDELEAMAARIQAGERAAGKPDFWGFVWQGAAYEGLTCDALEWQMSHGGGRIIEEDGTISVNNPRTIRAMKRARRWVGTISPSSVTEFKEEDAGNAFMSGNVAFRRGWIWTVYSRGQEASSAVRGKFAVSLLPSGGAGHASVLGGPSLAVSKYSAHPHEAVELVRYLTSREVQLQLWKETSLLPPREDFYQDPQHFHLRPDLERLKDVFTAGAVARPSTITGKRYAEVSLAYFTAVHSVLTGEVTAEKAMAELEGELVRITGFKPGKPDPALKSRAMTH